MLRSGYVLAGFETLAGIVDRFIKGERGTFNDNFTRKDVSRFLSSTSSGFLHSYGQNFDRKKNLAKHDINETSMYQKCIDMEIFEDCDFIVDSGGFQISTGRFSRTRSEHLFKMYYEWVKNNHELISKAFILDIPPGPGCKIFHDFDDVYKLNLECYLIARDLPDEVRNKMIYIHHFRSPKLWEIYTKIMRDNELFPYFNYHGTGGIVANMATDMSIPCIIYVLPLIPLLNECKKYNRDFLNFHILGGANWRDILFYEFFTKIVWDKHKIKLNMTYDSSGPYKQSQMARYIHVKDGDGFVRKMSLKSSHLDKRFYKGERCLDAAQRLVDHVADTLNFKRIKVNGLYDDETNTYHEDMKIYLTLFYPIMLFSEIQEWLREYSDEIYPLYVNGEIEEFHQACLNATSILNQGKITKKQKIKSFSIARSLDMLTNLDEDYCEYIVKKVLAKDEFFDLDERTRIMKI